jgi:hypothetical protein
MDGRAYLLDLCDEALGEAGERDAAPPWLLSAADGEPVRVAAVYPTARVVLELWEAQEPLELDRRAAIVEAYGLAYVLLDEAAITREREADRDYVLEQIAGARDLGWEQLTELNPWRPGAVIGINVGVGVEEDWDGEEDDPFGEGFDENADEEDPPLPNVALAWRGRAMALALLGAAALTRRAFASSMSGHEVSRRALQALLALAVAHEPASEPALEPQAPPEWSRPGLTRETLAHVIVADPDDVGEALTELSRRGLADEDFDGAWTISEFGVTVVVDWLGRVSPLFEGWPRDLPDLG